LLVSEPDSTQHKGSERRDLQHSAETRRQPLEAHEESGQDANFVTMIAVPAAVSASPSWQAHRSTLVPTAQAAISGTSATSHRPQAGRTQERGVITEEALKAAAPRRPGSSRPPT
jgi:hypothetical protein